MEGALSVVAALAAVPAAASFALPRVCCSLRRDARRGEAVFELGRHAFDLRLLGPLQRLVDAHPLLYIGFMFFSLLFQLLYARLFSAHKVKLEASPMLF